MLAGSNSVVREKAATIDAAAAVWVIRLDRGLTDSERRALEDWLAGDERRSGALARAQAAWVHADRGRVLHPRETSYSTRFWGAKSQWRTSRWLAAAAVLVLGLGVALWARQDHRGIRIATAVGETREVRLSDGSEVTLGSKSEVSVAYQSSIRIVRLDYGQTLFEVAHDPRRPFVAEAGDLRVRAVGTAFSIHRLTGTVAEVTVSKGTVEVWRVMALAQPPIRVAAGNRILVTPQEITSLQELSGSDLGRTTPDVLDMNGWTLAQAAAEFNRFNRRSVVIADPKLAKLRVVGRFHISDPEAFVTAAAAMLDARARRDGDRLILEPRPRQ